MKPAPFDYAHPRSLDHALDLLAQDEDARALAGGQSLVPMLNFRLARPSLLVDLNPLEELERLHVSDRTLRIGALTRQAALLRSADVVGRWGLLARAAVHVGHAAIRSRGTVGGSVAHADPAAELPVALTALDARFHLRSAAGERTLTPSDMFVAALTTALAPDELVTEIEVPAPPDGTRMAFAEHARTHGDFALAGVAVAVAPGEHAAVALLGAAPTPVRAPAAERALLGGASRTEAARLAADGIDDEHRRALIAALAERALDEALG